MRHCYDLRRYKNQPASVFDLILVPGFIFIEGRRNVGNTNYYRRSRPVGFTLAGPPHSDRLCAQLSTEARTDVLPPVGL